MKYLRGWAYPVYAVSLAKENYLEQQFLIASQDQTWATDITCIRTLGGWLYQAVVFALYSRMVVGWPLKETLYRERALEAILMAVRHRHPNQEASIPTRGFNTAVTFGCVFAVIAV